MSDSCSAYVASYSHFDHGATCPAPRVDLDAPHALTYEGCRRGLPPRSCAAPLPATYAAPTEDRLFAPRPEAVFWPRYPEYPQAEPAEGSAVAVAQWQAGGRGTKGKVDCFKCFSFAADRVVWEQYVRHWLEKAVPGLGGPAVRTVLDVGAGAGGLLAVLQKKHAMQGIGVTMSGPNSPYLETMAARGVLGLQASLTDRLPFADGAFDLIHSRLSGLRFAEGQGRSGGSNSRSRRMQRAVRAGLAVGGGKVDGDGDGGGRAGGKAGGKAGGGGASSFELLEATMYEWDRLVRPGGYLVQTGWKLGRGPNHWNRTTVFFKQLAARLQWRELLLHEPTKRSNSIEFAYQKPTTRPNLPPP